MLYKVKRTNLFATGRKAALIFLTAASLVFQAGCKDDDNRIDPDGNAADPTATIPAKGKNTVTK